MNARSLFIGTVATIATSGLVTGAQAHRAAGQYSDSDSEKHSKSRCSTRVEDRNLTNFNNYLDALFSGNSEAALGAWAEEGVVEVQGSVPYAGTYRVVDGTYNQVLGTTWSIEPPAGGQNEIDLWADCDQVILRGAFDATSIATGEKMSTSVIEIFSFNDKGKIIRDDFAFTDTVVVAEALTPDSSS